MSERENLADVLERLALIPQGLAGAAAPTRDDPVTVAGNVSTECLLCLVEVSSHEHDPECPWVLARRLAPSDLAEVQRLVRVLRYVRGGPA